VTILSTICGVAWWMGALFSRVKAIQQRLESFTAEAHKEIKQLDRRVDEHDQRISVIEVKLE
jgi:hypothetical protein